MHYISRVSRVFFFQLKVVTPHKTKVVIFNNNKVQWISSDFSRDEDHPYSYFANNYGAGRIQFINGNTK